MSYPIIHPIVEPFSGLGADRVRGIAKQYQFTKSSRPRYTQLYNEGHRGFSEIWYKLAGRGYATIRVDTVGHARLKGWDETERKVKEFGIGGRDPGLHGRVPHYHKEWIAAEHFERYLRDYAPQVICYDDAGIPVFGPWQYKRWKEDPDDAAESWKWGPVRTDKWASRTHIKR